MSIPLADIVLSDYQRGTNARQVNNIVRKFDEAKLGTLTVSEREGNYHLIDGAHRSRALRILKYTHAPCLVFTGWILEGGQRRCRGVSRQFG